MKSTLTSLFLAAVFLLSSGSASVLYTRQTGPLPSFNDPLNAAGDDYIGELDAISHTTDPRYLKH